MKFYSADKDAVIQHVNSTPDGLTSAEAEKRLAENGKNKLAEGKKESLLHRFLKQLAEPMTIILLVAAAISAGVEIYNGLAANHWEFPADVVIILAVVIINAVLGVLQESKAEKAIEALQEIAAATSKVIRDGKQISVRSEDLVVGDVILLEAGDSVPADARIIECASMKIEEAALTGESVPVDKKVEALTLGENGDVPLGDRKNMVFMGSTVVYGRGKAVIVATGMDTEMGKIADALANAKEEDVSDLKAEFEKIYSTKKELTPDQRELLALRDTLNSQIVDEKTLEDEESLLRTARIKKNIDYFVASSEISNTQKKECLEKLKPLIKDVTLLDMPTLLL